MKPSIPRDQSEVKNNFHRTYLAVLGRIAQELGLNVGDYEIRSNKGGPAVLGEVTLHADKVYIQVGGSDWVSVIDPEHAQVLYRSCRGRKDFVGGTNRYIPLSWLTLAPERAVKAFQETAAASGKEPSYPTGGQ